MGLRGTRGALLGAATALALAAPAPAAAAPDLTGVSGPEAVRTVDLSGRWTFVPSGQAATTIQVPGGGWVKQGFPRVAQARYERRVAIPDEAAGHVIRLVFGAVNHEATLSVDGRRVATNTTSFTQSVFDISHHVRPGATHTIAIDVRGREAMLGDARPATPTLPGVPTGVIGAGYTVPDAGSWSEGIPQGIFGPPPRLEILPRVRIVDGFVRTSVADDTLAADVTVANATDERREVRVGGDLTSDGPSGFAYPAVGERTVALDPGQERTVTLGPVPWRLGRASYWWPNVPYRPGYRAQLHDLDLRLDGGAAQVASAVGLPATRRCVSRRRFVIRLRGPRGDRKLRSARVRVGGRRVRVLHGKRLRAPIDLRGLPAGRVTVRVDAVTRSGRRVRDVRRYRTCARKPRARRGPRAAVRSARIEHAARYRFGFRSSRQVGTHYELNGVRVNYRGDSLTGGIYDRIAYGGGPGDAFHTFPGFLPPSDGSGGWPQAVDNFQRLNMNTVRIHQEPASPYMLDVADERGLLIIGETAVRGSESKQDFIAGRDNMLAHTRDLVRRDRHHASVVRWSQSNEPDANGRGEPKDFQLDLFRTVMAADGTRPVSVDVTSNKYEDMPDGNFSVYQHYVNENGSVGGYTDDVHPRDDRPFGRGEFIWPLSDRRAFAWFGTATQKMREKDGSDIRPYALACTFGNVIPGVTRTSYLCDNDLPPLFGEDNLPDPWSDPTVRRVQQGFHPVLVADSAYWEQHKQSDPTGAWPTPTSPTLLTGGQVARRSLVVFNDTFAGERVDVRWELRRGAADGPVVEDGAFAIDVPLGGRSTREIAFTPPAGGGRAYLVLTAAKPGEGELFRETDQVFDVLPTGAG